MRWVDFEGKKPTDDDIPGWTPWSTEEWQAWLDKSDELLREVERLHNVPDIEARNKYIDDNSDHWGKLKPWLFAISHGKCWFTEGRDICSHKDVEHFRPKKLVKNIDKTEQDGYWWLSFNYRNFRASGNVPNRKKGNWFPLHEDSRRSQWTARCEESEAPYLLDPIRQTDAELVAFDDEGNAIPAPGIDPWEKLRVERSIEWLKLNEHDDLPEERRKVWQEVSQAIDAYLEAKKAYRPGINPAPAETMEQQLREIRKKTREKAELSSVAIWCVRFRNDDRLLRLVQT
ncbi:MAG: hypothetical protein HQ518_30570 [Rhodopirellula sp.]|nr:hypothetical protein [Rhodopirellula sp.]